MRILRNRPSWILLDYRGHLPQKRLVYLSLDPICSPERKDYRKSKPDPSCLLFLILSHDFSLSHRIPPSCHLLWYDTIKIVIIKRQFSWATQSWNSHSKTDPHKPIFFKSIQLQIFSYSNGKHNTQWERMNTILFLPKFLCWMPWILWIFGNWTNKWERSHSPSQIIKNIERYLSITYT